jgi:transposase-like protein
MKCPKCFTEMRKTVHHYGDEREEIYKCPLCGYEEHHWYHPPRKPKYPGLPWGEPFPTKARRTI